MLSPEWSSYRFGFDNPLRFIDLTGMFEDDVESDGGDPDQIDPGRVALCPVEIVEDKLPPPPEKVKPEFDWDEFREVFDEVKDDVLGLAAVAETAASETEKLGDAYKLAIDVEKYAKDYTHFFVAIDIGEKVHDAFKDYKNPDKSASDVALDLEKAALDVAIGFTEMNPEIAIPVALGYAVFDQMTKDN